MTRTYHAVCITQDLFGLLIVDIADIVEGDEKLERILGIGLADPALDFLLDFVFAFLSVTCEAKEFVFVCPEHRFVLPYIHTRHDVVQMDDGIFGSVADHHEEAALLLLEAIANEGGDT